MGLLVDYFADVDDASAASTLAAGPSAPVKRGLFRKEQGPPRRTIDGHGIEPTVQLGQLDGLLTGRPFEDVLDDGESFAIIADADGGERLVMRLGRPFEDAILAASDDALQRVAEPWSQTEEFFGQASPAELATFLRELRDLTGEARRDDKAVYCWLSV